MPLGRDSSVHAGCGRVHKYLQVGSKKSFRLAEEAVDFACGENRNFEPDCGLCNIDHFPCAFIGSEGTRRMADICKGL
jgi:hypothetical protein